MHAPDPDDLPAAHSMDTEWFAIDALGHVGTFDSGEGGGLPEAHLELWHQQSGWTTLLDELCRLMAPGSLRFVAEDVFEEQPPHEWEQVIVVDDPGALDFGKSWADPALLELARAPELAGLDAAFGHGNATLLATDTAPMIYVASCHDETLAAAWHTLGVVRARMSYTLAPARVGVFAYDNSSYDGRPYDRIAVPLGAPLRAAELPIQLRRRLDRVRLTHADFRRDATIQPFEHVPSTIWVARWVGTDGEIHEYE